jgi:glycosyltransferase involved in cell wall biosynthesis
MVIGVDLRIFQIGHQYRGIGAHIYNLLREISEMPKSKQPEFIFYEHQNIDSGIGILDKFSDKLSFTVRYTDERLVGETFFEREWNSFQQRNIDGSAGLGDLSGIDVLLSIDFNLGVPKPNKVKTVLITYDLIPWILSEHYLPNFLQVFSSTHNFKKAVRAQIEKRLYRAKFWQANKRASKILSISEHTKLDLVDVLKIDEHKIKTVLLGIDKSTKKKVYKPVISTVNAQGAKKSLDTSKTKYVFFMGGADRRRKIEDLVSAFDATAEDSKKFALVLAGYDFQNIEGVPDQTTKEAIMASKYVDRIYFAGFITEAERNSLFSNSVAFVFPSSYEGFGLPILEAMEMGCITITYNNSSIAEVGRKAVLYAKDGPSIAAHIESLLDGTLDRSILDSRAKAVLKDFSWEKCAKQTLKEL